MCVLVPVCVSICIWVEDNVYELVYWGQRAISGVSLSHSPLYFTRRRLSLSLEVTNSGWLATKPHVSSCYLLQHWNCNHVQTSSDFTLELDFQIQALVRCGFTYWYIHFHIYLICNCKTWGPHPTWGLRVCHFVSIFTKRGCFQLSV